MERNRLIGRLFPLILLGLSGGALAVEVFPQPQATGMPQSAQQIVQQASVQRLSALIGQRPTLSAARLELTDADRERIDADNRAARSGAPLKVGLVKALDMRIDLQPLDVDAMTDQTYSFLDGHVRRAEGHLTWAVRLDTVGAAGARFRFDDISLPNGASIHVYNDAGASHTYSADRKSFWTHSVTGDQIYIQVELPDQASDNARFQIGAVMLLDASSEAFCPNNASCVEDGSCHDASEWSEIDKARKAVARFNFIENGWSYLCSGGLLADTDDTTAIPYFLTADHCVSTREVAATVETWFDFRTASCNSECPTGPGTSSTLGATLLNNSALNDHSLLLLDEKPPADAWFLGWTDTPVARANETMLYRLSHPGGSPQAYSTHRIDTNAETCGSLPRGPFIYSRDVVGATEGGSSGSPVMQSNGQVVGQLYGACGLDPDNVCDVVNNASVDGAFASYFQDVAKWLKPDPLNLPLTLQKFGSGKGRVQSSLDAGDPEALAQAGLSATPKLAGGTQVAQTDWPWQAAIKISTWRVNGEWTCGGSVIDSRWVLTAAHCIVDGIEDPYHEFVTVAPANIQIRVGSERFEFGGQTTGVRRIVKHPDFDPVTRDNDLALLELKEAVFVDPVRPVTPEREEKQACPGIQGAVTGWGTDAACGQTVRVLSKVNASLVDPAQCRTAYGDDSITGNMLCTAPGTDNGTLCQADEGSPLVVSNGRGGYVQAGIVSRGDDNCDNPSSPAVHTRVANYVGWMEGMTGLDLTSEVGSGIIDCGSTCSAEYPSGTTLTLTATADPGSVFAGWSGDCEGVGNTCQLTVTRALNVRATFNSINAQSRACAGSP